MTNAADRHLLFGLLALQNGIINQGQLVSAFQAWTLEKSRSLADHLEARGDLDADDRSAIEALVRSHLKRHGGDAEKSLAAMSAGKSTHQSLARFGDADIEATLDRVGPPHVSTVDVDLDRTPSYAVGSATSDGQRFRVLRPHARGGLGAVFVALDAELNREVALKQILEYHADDPTSRQRFVIEAEITGGLEHPGIVPVYGLGTYDDGRPFYAMRFITGESLKRTIDHFHGDAALNDDPGRRSLELRKLLRRFTDVCNAIDYAHSRGILHRDLKPANIIVGNHGETLVVDWGMAKFLGRVEPGQESSERVLVPSSASGSAETLPGSAIGTPAYMSPEQARGELDRLGSRTDVYSLGATLYCLLTGRAPFEGEDIGEVLLKVQRGDFVPPRSIDARIDPALEAVCLKATALRLEDRYATCRALADDIERWMADEPVSAWREPWSRRTRRWARRNRTAVVSLAASVLVALAGTGAVLAVQTQANGRLTQANQNLAAANGREKQRFNLAMEAIKLFHGEVSNDLVLKAHQFKPLRDKLLRGALDFYGTLDRMLEGQPDAASRRAMGNAYFELGELTAKIGDKPTALAAHRNGLAVRRELVLDPAADIDAHGDVARSLCATAYLLDRLSNSAQAMASYEEARDLIESLPLSGHGSDGRRALLGFVYREIGWVFLRTAKTTSALAAYEQSAKTLMRLVDDNPADTQFQNALAGTYNAIGGLQSKTGKHLEALESYRRAVTIQQKLAHDNPAVAEFQNTLALTYNDIGQTQALTNQPGEALESYMRAVAIQQTLANLNPAVSDFRNYLGITLYGIGLLHWNTGKPVESLESFRRAAANHQKLADDNPAVTEYSERLASCHNIIGAVQAQTGKPIEALESFRRALAIQQKLADDNPAVADFRNRLAGSQTNIGWLLVQNGRAAEAVAEFSREQAIRTGLVKDSPSVPEYRNDLANCQTNLATALLSLGRPAEARALCEQAVRLREVLVNDHPESTRYRRTLGESLFRSGVARRDQGDAAGAATDWRRADAMIESAGTLDPEMTFVHACCHASLSWAAGKASALVSANEADKAVALLRHAAAIGFRSAADYRNEPALDLLRDRPDFRLILLDLNFPADPFVPEDHAEHPGDGSKEARPRS